jgi:chemotaxis protein methyltransferase CheR
MAFTFFFRDIHTLERIAEYLIPEVSGKSKIKIWDAGCANGPEPYSLAIVLAERMGKFAFSNLLIDATDIDESGFFGDIIKEGVYSYEEVGRISEDVIAKYFEKVQYATEKYKIVDNIKTKLKFTRHNLLSLNPIGDNYSLIMCKNVLLHFQYEERIEVIKMFHKSLLPGGFFATEQTQKMPVEIIHLFEQVTPDAQLFRRIG